MPSTQNLWSGLLSCGIPSCGLPSCRLLSCKIPSYGLASFGLPSCGAACFATRSFGIASCEMISCEILGPHAIWEVLSEVVPWPQGVKLQGRPSLSFFHCKLGEVDIRGVLEHTLEDYIHSIT